MDRRMRLAASSAALIVTMLSAAPVGAVDGVIEINHARAVAGSITPGDTPGYPVTISQPGSYRLTGDLGPVGELVPANSNAVDITADDVTLDLNGFTIRHCDNVGFGRGILVHTHNGTTLRNGNVACDVNVDANSHIEGLQIDGNLAGDRGSIVRRNRVSKTIIFEFSTINENTAERIVGGFSTSQSLCTQNVVQDMAGCRHPELNTCCSATGSGGCQDCP